MATVQSAAEPARTRIPERCVIVVDEALPPGLAANAAAMVALTLGARQRPLAGADLVDADGARHPGLIPQGLPVLRAPGEDLAALRERAVEAQLGVIGFPSFGQRTTDYDAVRAHVAQTPTAELRYVALALFGPRRAVGKLTGNLKLLR